MFCFSTKMQLTNFIDSFHDIYMDDDSENSLQIQNRWTWIPARVHTGMTEVRWTWIPARVHTGMTEGEVYGDERALVNGGD